MRKLWFLWSAIAWISTALCTAGCVLPYWLKGTIYTGINEQFAVAMGLHMTRLPSTLGLYRRCVYPVYTDKVNEPVSANQDAASTPNHYIQTTEQARLIRIRAGCGFYQFEQIPHSFWRAALMLLSLACVVLWFISFFLLFVGCYVGLLNYPTLTRACQALLLVSGSLVLACCVLYPLGWSDNPEVTQICGDRSSVFHLGRCQLGWAYLLTLLGGFSSILASALPSLCGPCLTSSHHRFLFRITPSDPTKNATGEMELSRKPQDYTHCSGSSGPNQTMTVHSNVVKWPGTINSFYARVQQPVFVSPGPSPNIPTQSIKSHATNSSLMGSFMDMESKVPNDIKSPTVECSEKVS
ncbi:lipoma HMGIC fusion partner homolog [Clonorchis sinensis]|uniref:Lipoma HMGIC fusion partner homolog n=1 Tax=Clonorchis sinensis TaxID=79923 RepID=G7YRH2_CLOSI|nr:lipoma HMGIC fusion partner homolog [Clonorchis sinensis]